MHGQDQHLHVRILAVPLAQRIQPAHVLHAEVQQQNVRTRLAQDRLHVLAVATLGDHLVAGLILDQRSQTGPHQGVIVYQGNTLVQKLILISRSAPAEAR